MLEGGNKDIYLPSEQKHYGTALEIRCSAGADPGLTEEGEGAKESFFGGTFTKTRS